MPLGVPVTVIASGGLDSTEVEAWGAVTTDDHARHHSIRCKYEHIKKKQAVAVSACVTSPISGLPSSLAQLTRLRNDGWSDISLGTRYKGAQLPGPTTNL
jgi:hypothetical protein